jgi:hypothetical protein
MLRDLPAREPRPGFAERVVGRIREEDLAERARQRIVAAPVPLWKNAVQVAIGAIAASLVLAVVGMPGLWERTQPDIPGVGGENVAMAPTESDLLPALGDHSERLHCLRRNINCANLRDADMQRELVRAELEASDLARRNSWLAGEVARLPLEQRVDYLQFIEGLDRAIALLNTEIADSNRDRRPLDLGRVREALGVVHVPATLQAGYEIASRVAAPAQSPVSRSDTTQLSLFREIRLAEYSHDPHGVISGCESYTARFPQGELVWQANAAKVSALLKLGRDRDAARHYDAAFSRYDSDQSPALRAMLKDHFRASEVDRLANAFREMKAE